LQPAGKTQLTEELKAEGQEKERTKTHEQIFDVKSFHQLVRSKVIIDIKGSVKRIKV